MISGCSTRFTASALFMTERFSRSSSLDFKRWESFGIRPSGSGRRHSNESPSSGDHSAHRRRVGKGARTIGSGRTRKRVGALEVLASHLPPNAMAQP